MTATAPVRGVSRQDLPEESGSYVGDLADAVERYRVAEARYAAASARSAQVRLTGRRREWLAANDASLAAAAGLGLARDELVAAALAAVEAPGALVRVLPPDPGCVRPGEAPLDGSPLFLSLGANHAGISGCDR